MISGVLTIPQIGLSWYPEKKSLHSGDFTTGKSTWIFKSEVADRKYESSLSRKKNLDEYDHVVAEISWFKVRHYVLYSSWKKRLETFCGHSYAEGAGELPDSSSDAGARQFGH